MLTVLDEYSRECLAIVVARRLQTLTENPPRAGPRVSQVPEEVIVDTSRDVMLR